MYCKYVNNRQRKGTAVQNAINKIAVVSLSMNCTYLFVGKLRRRSIRRIVAGLCDVIK